MSRYDVGSGSAMVNSEISAHKIFSSSVLCSIIVNVMVLWKLACKLTSIVEILT